MDYSSLDPAVWMVHWTEGKGEIEYQTPDGQNENGLREAFYDVTPYVPFFQQYLALEQDLTLDQAKKVQIDLIKMLYEAKRQAPYHHPIVAGDYWWDATDGVLAATSGGLANTTSKLNEVVTRLNALISAFNGNAGISNALVGEINNKIVTGNQNEVDYLNNTILGIYQTFTDTNTINDCLRAGDLKGLSADIIASPKYVVDVGPGTCATVSGTPIDGVTASANANWIPLGQYAPVSVTPDEQIAILSGIAARSAQLYLIENQKIGEVNALTTVADVIAYDVLADWPTDPASPFKLEPPIVPIGGGLTILNYSTTGGDFPEAPIDGVTYGRRNMAWNPALALSGDVLDGGTF